MTAVFPAGSGLFTPSSGFPRCQDIQRAGTKPKLGGGKIGVAMSCSRYFTSTEVNLRFLCVRY